MDKLEKIAVLDSEVQAELVDSVLEEREIPHLMRSYHDSAYDGIFQTYAGWGHVEAPAAFRDEILAVIEDVKRQAASGAGPEQRIKLEQRPRARIVHWQAGPAVFLDVGPARPIGPMWEDKFAKIVRDAAQGRR